MSGDWTARPFRHSGAVLDSPDPTLAADAATALGMIGDARSIPHLTFPAASPGAPEPFGRPPKRRSPVSRGDRLRGSSGCRSQVLTDAAWRFHRHQADWC